MSQSMTKATNCPQQSPVSQYMYNCSLISDQSSLGTQWVAKDPVYHVDSEDWSDWANAQAEQSPCLAHRSFCWFYQAQAQLCFFLKNVCRFGCGCENHNDLKYIQADMSAQTV